MCSRLSCGNNVGLLREHAADESIDLNCHNSSFNSEREYNRAVPSENSWLVKVPLA